jgi:5-enolpyruvylshikimate-3-phosphate synthase
MNKKVSEELLKDLEEIKRMNKEMKEPEVMIYAIKNLPIIKTNGKIFRTEELSEHEKETLTNKLMEAFEMLIDYSKLEIEIMKDKKQKTKDKISVEKIVIEGDYDEAMDQLENADIPEEVKEIARKEIRKHFKDSL